MTSFIDSPKYRICILDKDCFIFYLIIFSQLFHCCRGWQIGNRKQCMKLHWNYKQLKNSKTTSEGIISENVIPGAIQQSHGYHDPRVLHHQSQWVFIKCQKSVIQCQLSDTGHSTDTRQALDARRTFGGHGMYCHVPVGWGLQQTTLAPGSNKTWARDPPVR